LTMLYRSTDRLCRCGAPVKNLSHSASFESLDKNAPSKSGTKQLGSARFWLALEAGVDSDVSNLSLTLQDRVGIHFGDRRIVLMNVIVEDMYPAMLCTVVRLYDVVKLGVDDYDRHPLLF
jgi:hypothetical protein